MSGLPSRENDYKQPAPPAPANLTRDIWDSVFGDISHRLRDLEARGTELDEVLNELRLFGLERLDTAIVPLIAQTQQQLAQLQQAVADTIAQNAQVIENFQVDVQEALAALNAQIAAVEARVNEILQGGIPAADVAESATQVFVSPEQRAEISELRADLEALLLSLDETFAAIGQNKQDKSEKNQPNGYPGLDNDGKLPQIVEAGLTAGMVVRAAYPLDPEKWVKANGAKYLKSAYPDYDSSREMLSFGFTVKGVEWTQSANPTPQIATNGRHVVWTNLYDIYEYDAETDVIRKFPTGVGSVNIKHIGWHEPTGRFDIVFGGGSYSHYYRSFVPGAAPTAVTQGAVTQGASLFRMSNGYWLFGSNSGVQSSILPYGPWSAVTGPLSAYDFTEVEPGVIYAMAGGGAAESGRIWKSTDYGANWVLLANLSSGTSALGFYDVPNHAYLTFFNGYLYANLPISGGGNLYRVDPESGAAIKLGVTRQPTSVATSMLEFRGHLYVGALLAKSQLDAGDPGLIIVKPDGEITDVYDLYAGDVLMYTSTGAQQWREVFTKPPLCAVNDKLIINPASYASMRKITLSYDPDTEFRVPVVDRSYVKVAN